ncbi:MAG: Hsp20/alpha crystallin family protein [Candidatus Altiarchaeota archaeon]
MEPWEKGRERFPPKPTRLEEEIRKLEEEFSRALTEGGSFGYGFTIVSVNGTPIEQKVFRSQQPQIEEREPLVDIIDEKETTKILVDLPGIEKKDILLTSDDNTLEISVDTEQRKYHKRLELPHTVKNPKAEYRNGVLEVSIRKEKAKDVKIG